MWSSWAWVRTTPTTRSGSSASQVKSGRMMSTPGWSASGKARPQSISSRAPSSSTTAQLRPISPSPPRKATRTAPGAGGGGAPVSAARSATRAPAEAGAGQQAAQVHAGLEQDRAGGREQPLEQGQVPGVEVQRGPGVAPLEGGDQLLEGGADQVGGDADDADAADGEQRQEVLVVAGVLLHPPAGVAVQAAGGGHVADGVLDRHDVVDLLEQPHHRRHLDGAGGAAGDVVEHAGQAGASGDGAEVGDQPGLGGLVVVGRDQQQRADAGLLV